VWSGSETEGGREGSGSEAEGGREGSGEEVGEIALEDGGDV
jgi:hypothetical protein